MVGDETDRFASAQEMHLDLLQFANDARLKLGV